MDGRKDRILVPSAVALISIGSTLWLASGGTENPLNYFCIPSDGILRFLVGAGVVTLGIGYLCNALFVLLMLLWPAFRFDDFKKLMNAFGLEEIESADLNWWHLSLRWQYWDRRKQLMQSLLDEFHLRLHSHAPQTLIDYCSRRNTAWYIANTSGIASIIGWFAASIIYMVHQNAHSSTVESANLMGDALVIAVMLSFLLIWLFERPTRETAFIGFIVVIVIAATFWLIIDNFYIELSVLWFGSSGRISSIVVFLVVIPCSLFWQGKKWNREFWGVCWRWIYWDQQTHSPTPGWLGIKRPSGVEWLTGVGRRDGNESK